MLAVRVSIITSAHRYDDGRVLEREAVSLALAGFEVRLTAPGAPSTEIEGVRVAGPDLPNGRLRRMTVTLWRVCRQGVADADVVHIHDPELLVLLAVLSLRRKRPKLVYDVHEDYPAQISEKPWIPPIARRAASASFRRFESVVSRRCDLIIAATPHIASRFPDCRTALVQNMPRVDTFPMTQDPVGDDRFHVVHVGEMNKRRGVDAMLRAAEALSDEGVDFQQIGPVKPAELRAECEGMVEVIDRLPHDELLRRLGQADAGLLLFHRGANHDESQPNKLFEYLVLGLPIVASDIPHWRTLAGSCAPLIEFVDPHDHEAVVSAIRRLRDRAPTHDRRPQALRARVLFSWANEADALTEAYRGLASGESRSTISRPAAND